MTIERPHRVDHTYLQQLKGTPDQVFPLLCPVREKDWVRGWDPSLVITESGLAEPGCIFMTEGDFGESTWFISALDRERYHIEFVKFTPGYLVVFIAITVVAKDKSTSTAECRYQQTAVGEDGWRFVAEYTRDDYVKFMKVWEEELNHFLETGRMIGSATSQDG